MPACGVEGRGVLGCGEGDGDGDGGTLSEGNGEGAGEGAGEVIEVFEFGKEVHCWAYGDGSCGGCW